MVLPLQKGFSNGLRKSELHRDARLGQLKDADQHQLTITDGDFRLQVASNSVKGFDERADMAAEALGGYLKNYEERERTRKTRCTSWSMTLLERNQRGDLDYKSISKLCELEDRFGDQEYKGHHDPL